MESALSTDALFLKKFWVNKMDRGATGKKGEEFACEYYRKLGYDVRQMNYHSRYGEIDVIAENESNIVFCEVKTRSSSTKSKPCEAVDYAKQQKLTLTAFRFLTENACEKTPRFDIFEVWVNYGRIYKYNNIENAFEPSDFSGRYDIF